MTASALETAVDLKERELGRLSVDYTWWDVAVEQIANGIDPVWADGNLGPWLFDEYGVDTTAIVDAAGRTLYFAQSGERTDEDARVTFPPAVDTLIEEARATSFDDPDSVQAFLAWGGSTYLVGVSPFTNEDADVAAAGPAVRPVLILADRIDAAWVQQMASVTGVDSLGLNTGPPLEEGGLPLPGPDGAAIAYLTWAPSRQAAQMISAMAPWLIAAFGITMVLSALVAMRFSGAARELAWRNEALMESEANAIIARRHAENANRAKSHFLAGVSHEVRTPLNAIIGFSDLMRNEVTGPISAEMSREYAGHIYYSGQQLLALINDILDLAKVEAGRMELRDETVDLGRLFETSIRTLRPVADKRRIALEADCPTTLPLVRVDPLRLEQVLLNLLGNAVKFTEPGGTVRLGALRSPAGIEISITDTGIGIAETDLATVFEPFSQVGNPMARREGGVGLGLALARQFCVAFGGSIDLRSTPGVGTTARVVLPEDRIVDGPSLEPEQAGPRSRGPVKPTDQPG